MKIYLTTVAMSPAFPGSWSMVDIIPVPVQVLVPVPGSVMRCTLHAREQRADHFNDIHD
jgi:hypothetical protein